MKKIILLLTLLISITEINAQGFWSIANAVDSLYPNDTAEDGLKAKINRLKRRWDGQINSQGTFTTAAQNFKNFSTSLVNYRAQTTNCMNTEPQWTEIGPVMEANNTNNLAGAGLMHRMTFHPNYGNTFYTDAQGLRTIFALSGFGGIWKSTDDGDTWARLNTDNQIPFSSFGVLVIDPVNPNRMYVTTGTPNGAPDVSYITLARDFPLYTLGIYGTDDGGLNWVKINNGISTNLTDFGGSIYNLQMDPTNHNNLIFTSTKGLYYCTNPSGLLSSIQWINDTQFNTLSSNDDQIVGLTFNPTNNVWFVSGLNIFSSSNPFIGSNWVLSTGAGSGLDLSSGNFPGTSDQIKRINIVNSELAGQTNEVYALIYAGVNKIGIAKKVGLTNWYIVPKYFVGGAGRSIDKQGIVAVPGSGIAPNNTDYYIGNNSYYFYESGSNTLYGDYPYGGTGLHADIQSLYIHSSQPNNLWFASDGGISLKLRNIGAFNGGASYKNNGIQAQLIWDFDDSELDANYYLAALQDNAIQFKGGPIAGNSWNMMAPLWSIGDGYSADIYDKDPSDGMITGTLGYECRNFNYLTGTWGGYYNTSPYYLANYAESNNYFADPQFPNEKVYIGFWNPLKTSNGTNWAGIGCNMSGQTIPLTYNSTTLDGLCYALTTKTAHQNYIVGQPFNVYAITKRTDHFQRLTGSNLTACDIKPNFTMPSIILKSTTGYGQIGDPDHFTTANTISITNALYDKAKLDGAILQTDFPQLSGVTCKPDQGDKVWVCSGGLLPHFKIWKSIDGGASWLNADPFDAFTNIPIFDIVAVEGSLDLVFAATLDGVYYSDNTMNGHWCRYGASPSVQTLKLKINSCKNKLIVSTYGRGAFEVSLPFQPVPSTDINVTQTWTTPHHFSNTSLTVKSGKTLTINNTACFFGPNSRLIVEKGAKLIVNNATLTSESSCNGYLWRGIEVQGDINVRQNVVSGYDANHGYAILQNNAIIEHAHYGIQNHVANNEDIDWSKLGGGIVRCTNAKFLNCQKAAQFMPYTNHNALGNIVNDLSYFTSCQFLTDATTASHNFIPETHAAFWQTKGINLTANTFKNLTPNDYPVESRGSGIISYDASYDVVRSCNPISISGACAGPQNVFENLYYAIDASASLPTASVRIIDNIFTNNHRGAVLHAVDYAQVMNNTMSIGEQYGPPSSIVAPCGIYLDGCDAYIVQNNTLNNATGTSSTLDFGIIASYSNNNPNELRQNNFNNIAVGIQAQDNNNGLQLKCNQFVNGTINTADVKILGQATQGSIAQQQGACSPNPTTLPGNEFSHTCAAAQDLAASNSAYQVTYNTRISNGSETPQASCYNATFYNVLGCLGVGNGVVCPATTGGGSGGGLNPVQLRLSIKNSKQDIKSLEQLLASGNTPNLYTVITNGNDNNVNNKLLQKSPYLSDLVLLAFLNHLPMFTETTIVNVLVANSPLSNQVAAVALSLKISASALNTIKNAQVGTSQRTYTEANLAYEKNQLIINYNNQLSYVLNDKDNEARFDSLILKYDFTINPKSRGLYAGALIDQQKYSQAQIQLDSMQSTNPQLKSFLEQLMQLRQIVNQIQGYSGDIKQKMDSLRLNRPADLAVKAQAVYNSIFKKPFGEQIYLTNAQQSNAARIAQIAKVEEQIENSIIVYPNPTNEQITFMFGTEKQSNCTIEMYNANGQLVKHKAVNSADESVSIEMQDLKDGIYFYRIYNKDTPLKAGKIVLIK